MNQTKELSILIKASQEAFNILNINEESWLFQLTTTLNDLINSDVNDKRQIEQLSQIKQSLTVFIRFYRMLHQFLGGDIELMNHWLDVENKYFNVAPRSLLASDEGIQQLTQYLDELRPDKATYRV